MNIIIFNTKNGMIIGNLLNEDENDFIIEYPYLIKSIDNMVNLFSVLSFSSDVTITLSKKSLIHSYVKPTNEFKEYYLNTVQYDNEIQNKELNKLFMESAMNLYQAYNSLKISEILDSVEDEEIKIILEQKMKLLNEMPPTLTVH